LLDQLFRVRHSFRALLQPRKIRLFESTRFLGGLWRIPGHNKHNLPLVQSRDNGKLMPLDRNQATREWMKAG